MQIGSLVRCQYKYPDGMEIDWIGIVAEIKPANELVEKSRLFYRVQWNSGVLDWRVESDLEAICK